MKIVLLLNLLVFVLPVQDPALSSVVGIVQSIDAPARALVVKTDQDATIPIKSSDTTLLLRVAAGAQSLSQASSIAFTDIAVGDRILARGDKRDSVFSALRIVVLSKTDLAKHREQELEDWKKRGVAGFVKAVNAEASEVSLQLRGATPTVLNINLKGSTVRRYASSSIDFESAQPSNVKEIAVGDQLRVLGDKSPDGATLKAQAAVFGTFKTVGVTITSVDPKTGLIAGTTLEHRQSIQIKVLKESLIHRIPASLVPQLVQRMRPPGGDVQQLIDALPAIELAEMKAGDVVSVTGMREDESNIAAIKIVAGVDAVLRALAPAPGRPQPVRLSAGLPNAFDFSVIPTP